MIFISTFFITVKHTEVDNCYYIEGELQNDIARVDLEIIKELEELYLEDYSEEEGHLQ